MPAAELDIDDIEVGKKATSTTTASSHDATAPRHSVDWGDDNGVGDGLPLVDQ